MNPEIKNNNHVIPLTDDDKIKIIGRLEQLLNDKDLTSKDYDISYFVNLCTEETRKMRFFLMLELSILLLILDHLEKTTYELSIAFISTQDSTFGKRHDFGIVLASLRSFELSLVKKIWDGEFLTPTETKLFIDKSGFDTLPAMFTIKLKFENNDPLGALGENIIIPEKFTISVRDREIWVNDYIIGKPHAVGNNYEFFEYVRSRPVNTQVSWNSIPDNVGCEMLKNAIKNRRFIKILNALGFKGEIKKLFFYKVGQDSLYYRGDEVTKEDLNKAGVRLPILLKELVAANIQNSPK